ncbi:MAG: class I SAM-dependent methyltransferase [Promethearchaeota archaeon]|nr:MAG: class I SAM-dependent methyltransferase [Candidatus Lokiarchaeota archaeon]
MKPADFKHIWEADKYDGKIDTLIPFYDQILESLISLLPFSEEEDLKLIDLGCGTGTLALRLKNRYPKAQITCLDIDEEMIKASKLKLKNYSNIKYIVSDFSNYIPDDNFDAVVSSLALHHIQEDLAKIENYTKIYNSLVPDGIFLNADVVSAPSEWLEEIYVEKWVEYELEYYTYEEVYESILPQMYHPGILKPLKPQLDMLQEIGLENVDVMWKYFHYAIFGGTKPSQG